VAIGVVRIRLGAIAKPESAKFASRLIGAAAGVPVDRIILVREQIAVEGTLPTNTDPATRTAITASFRVFGMSTSAY
jgi:hypothetical protein